MADIHAVDYNTDSEGMLRPPHGGLVETQDLVLACILGTFGFAMRGYVPVSVAFHADNIATILKQGHGNLRLCQVRMTFHFEGPKHPTYGQLTYSRIMAAYLLCRLHQRVRRGEEADKQHPEMLESMVARAVKCAQKNDVCQQMMYDVMQCIDMASNLFVMTETISELAKDPMLAVMRKLSKPGGLAHVAQPLNAESQVMAKRQFYQKV